VFQGGTAVVVVAKKGGGKMGRRIGGNQQERSFQVSFAPEGLKLISSWELTYITFQVKKSQAHTPEYTGCCIDSIYVYVVWLP
jgi:hypothetical protein